MNIAIGADHRGFAHKEFIKDHLQLASLIVWTDVGAFNEERSDYPLYAELVVKAMLKGEAEKGILICGSGVGMAIAANRFAGIYAGLAWNVQVATLNAADDNANILVLPSDFVTEQEAVAMVEAWLKTPFQGGRYQERIAMIDALKGI